MICKICEDTCQCGNGCECSGEQCECKDCDCKKNDKDVVFDPDFSLTEH